MRIVLVDPSRAIQRAMTDLIIPGEHEVLAFSEGQKALDCIGADDGVRSPYHQCSTRRYFRNRALRSGSPAGWFSSCALYYCYVIDADYGLVVQALDNGADDFIRKPPFPEELRARLRAADRLTLMQRDLIKYATTDFLTGLLNRRAFFEDAAAACKGAGPGSPLSAIIFDVDHFKRINDTHGHRAGDFVLASLGTAVKMVSNGIIGRLGGEEFCLLETCDLIDAVEIAENIRRSIKALRFTEQGLFGITCSFGVTEWESGDTIDRILRRADMAMYEAKSTGRDRVVASDTFALTDQHEGWRGTARTDKRNQ